jgi:ligand-binding sensor domain-containing protein
MDASKNLRGVVTLFLSLLCFLIVWSIHAELNPDKVNALWVAESEGVLKLRASDGSVLFEIPYASDIRGLAIDQKRGILWAASSKSLRAYQFDGLLLLNSPLPSYARYEEDHHKEIIPVVHPDNGHIFLARGKTLFHFNEEAMLVSSINISREIESLSLDYKHGTIWLATDTEIESFNSSDLSKIQTISFQSATEVEAIAYDESLDEIWAIVNHQVVRYSTTGQLVLSSSVKADETLSATGDGRVWAGDERNVSLLDSSGSELIRIRPFNRDDNNELKQLIVEPSDKSVWVAGQTRLAHISVDGQILNDIDIGKKVYDIAIYSDILSPTLKFILPEDGSYLNAQPDLKLEATDIGIGVDPATLDVKMNGADFPVSCVTNPISRASVLQSILLHPQS